MRILEKLERRFGSLAVANVSIYLVIGQVAVFLLLWFGRMDPGWFVLVPRAVLAGEWWRLFSFLLMPPPSNVIFIAFAWWLFYIMGTALEELWGAFRFNCFLLIGYLLTVGLSFLVPGGAVTNAFLAGSVFLAFAYLNPNFELLLIVIPVQIKWLALVTWVYYAIQFAVGSWPVRLQVVAAVGNVLLFFGRDAWHRAGARTRQARRSPGPAMPAVGGVRHRCRICGKTDKSNPELDFRYCSKCSGDDCYCPEHLFNHEHVRSGDGGS